MSTRKIIKLFAPSIVVFLILSTSTQTDISGLIAGGFALQLWWMAMMFIQSGDDWKTIYTKESTKTTRQ